MLATLIDNEMAFYDIIPLPDETFSELPKLKT